MTAERIIRRTLSDTQWVLSKERTIDSVIDKDRHLSKEEFSLYSKGSFDFVVQHEEDDEPDFAIEFDGPHHQGSIQAARDVIKNRLCHEAALPLVRIGFDELRERDEVSVLEWLVQRFRILEGSMPEAAGDFVARIGSAA